MTEDKKNNFQQKSTESTGQLGDMIGGEAGLLGPLAKQINQLAKDPILKKALESSQPYPTKKN